MDRRPFTLRDAVRGIYHRKIRIGLFIFGVLVLVGAVTILAPKSYYSDSKLFVRLGRENVGLDATTTLGEGPSVSVPLSREEEINSIVEMIKNKSVLQHVVDSVGARRILKRDNGDNPSDSSPSMIDSLSGLLKNSGILTDIDDRERAVIELRESISVEAPRKSNVIAVIFETHDPKLAQEVVTELVGAYLKQHGSLHRNDGALEFLRSKTEEARCELVEREKEFEEFKNRTGMISLPDERKVVVERIANLQKSQLEAAAAAKSMETEVARLKERLGKLPETHVITETVGAGNEGVDGMRKDLYLLELRYEEQKAKHSENHPSVQQIQKQVVEARKILASVAQQLTESVTGRNKVFEETKIELLKKEPQYLALVAKAEILQKQWAELTKELTTFNANETQFVEVQRAITIGDERYRKYRKNLDQAEIDFSLAAEELSNISVAQTATLNPKPHRPNKLLNLVLGLVAGVFGGCGLAVLAEFFDPTLRTREDVETALDLPVVAAVPSLRPRELPDTVASNPR